MQTWGILLGIIGISLAYVLALAFTAFWKSRRRYVTCPENGREVCVRCDARTAMGSVLTGQRQRVIGCTRWPEKEGCDRDCERGLGA